MSGVSSYELWRNNGGGPFALVASGIVTNFFDDAGRSAGTTYVYKLKAVVGSTVSSFSPPDLATTIAFTDDIALPGKKIRAVHMQELRDATNAVRAAASLAPLTFIDSVHSGVKVLARHITELRTALADAYTAIGMPSAPTFNESVVVGATIQGAAFQEVRNMVK